VRASISISGHNIAEPVQLSSTLAFEVECKEISVEQLVAFGEKF